MRELKYRGPGAEYLAITGHLVPGTRHSGSGANPCA